MTITPGDQLTPCVPHSTWLTEGGETYIRARCKQHYQEMLMAPPNCLQYLLLVTKPSPTFLMNTIIV